LAGSVRQSRASRKPSAPDSPPSPETRHKRPPLRPPAPDGFAPVPPRRALARPFNAAGTRARIPANVSERRNAAPPVSDSGDRVPRPACQRATVATVCRRALPMIPATVPRPVSG